MHKRIQNEAEERMPYEAVGGLVGAFVVRAWLRRTLDRLSGIAPVSRSVLLSVVPASSRPLDMIPKLGRLGRLCSG